MLVADNSEAFACATYELSSDAPHTLATSVTVRCLLGLRFLTFVPSLIRKCNGLRKMSIS